MNDELSNEQREQYEDLADLLEKILGAGLEAREDAILAPEYTAEETARIFAEAKAATLKRVNDVYEEVSEGLRFFFAVGNTPTKEQVGE